MFRINVLIVLTFLCGKCVCDLTLFVKKINSTNYNLTCEAKGEAAKTTITWLSKNLERNLQGPPSLVLNTSLANVLHIKPIGDSFSFTLPPVLDYRWENFPTIIVWKNKTIIDEHLDKIWTINISILHRSNFTVILRFAKGILCATVMQHQYDTILFGLCSRKTIHNKKSDELGFKHWKHFTIYKENNNYYLGPFNSKTVFQEIQIDSLAVKTDSVAQVKLHNYTVYLGKHMDVREDTCFYVFTSYLCDGLEGRTFEWLEQKVAANTSTDKYDNCLLSSRQCNFSETKRLQLITNDTNVACSSLTNEDISVNYRKPKQGDHSLDCVVCNKTICTCGKERTGLFCETGQNRVKNLRATVKKNLIVITWNPPNEAVDHYLIKYNQWNFKPIEMYIKCFPNYNEECEYTLESYIFPNLTYNISVAAKNKDEGYGIAEYCSAKIVVLAPKQAKYAFKETWNCGLLVNWYYYEESVEGFYIDIISSSGNYSDYVNVTESISKNNYEYKNSHITTGNYKIHIVAENILGKGDPEIIEGIQVDCIHLGTSSFIITVTAATTGLFVLILLIITCVKCCYYKKRFKEREPVKIYEDEYIPLEPANKLVIQRKHLNDVLQQWVANNIYDNHILQEFNDALRKNKALRRLLRKEFCKVKVRDLTCHIEVNAHYIQGHKGNKSYIAIQSPNNNKMNEAFWTVVWDEKISVVVSLLTEIECMELPCNYWNTNNSNSIQVELKLMKNFTDFQIRNINITRCGDTREVLQLHYFSWPTNSIPVNPNSFVTFLKCVKSKDRTNRPILVHSSESLGRSGTYIMCDYFINYKEAEIDVAKYFDVINKCRPKLIENFQQYKFLYYVIDELNAHESTKIITSKLMIHSSEMIMNNIQKHNAYIKRRSYIYKFLYYDEKEQESKTDWIVVPGYQNEYTFHVTKYPSPENVYKFWNYVYSRQITQILILQNLSQERGSFWPKLQKPLILNSMQVALISCNSDSVMKSFRISVKKDSQEPLEVVILYFKYWDPKRNIPNEIDEFYEFIKTYYHVKSIRDDKTILCCSDGALASGLFICIDFILKKLQKEDVFDLAWAVLSIKHKNERFMEIMDQHKFVYEIFKHFLDNEEMTTMYNDYDRIIDPDYDTLRRT